MTMVLVVIDMQNGFIDEKSRFLVPIIHEITNKFIVIADACFSTAGVKAHEAGLIAIKQNIGDKQLQYKNTIDCIN